VVELMVRRPVMRVVVAKGRDREKKKERGQWINQKSWFFGLFWTRFSPPPGHQTRLYL
jgi:hypothetical protein